MTKRAWAFNAEMTEMLLIDTGERALYVGYILPDGRRIARQAWAYEYRAPYDLGRVEKVGLAHYQPRPNAQAPEPAAAPVQRPRKAAKPRSVVGATPVGVILDEVSTWRSDRLAATIANPY